MVIQVLIPKEKAKPISWMKVKDEQERLACARVLMDSISAFINDDTIDEQINGGAGPGNTADYNTKLSPEQVEKNIKAGLGALGISTVIEPADLELYRSYLYPPLSMPEKPEVVVSLLDLNSGSGNTEMTRYMEGRVAIRAMCPDGIERWHLLSAPVANVFICWMGLPWGWPKYLADEITVTPTKAEVLYEGEVRLSMELTPGGVDEATEKELKERGGFERSKGGIVTFQLYKGGRLLVGGGPDKGDEGVKVVEWQAGKVKVYVKPTEPWAGLIPANSVTPGVYQWTTNIGGVDGVRRKIAKIVG